MRVGQQLDAAAEFGKTAHDVARPVRAHPVNHQNLDIADRALLTEQALQAGPDVTLLVVRSDDGGDPYAISAYNFVSFAASLVHRNRSLTNARPRSPIACARAGSSTSVLMAAAICCGSLGSTTIPHSCSRTTEEQRSVFDMMTGKPAPKYSKSLFGSASS